MPKVITLTTTDWELIETTYNQEGFTRYSDADISFSNSDNPNIDEIIPVAGNEKCYFEKATSFYVKGAVGTKIFLTPFDL